MTCQTFINQQALHVTQSSSLPRGHRSLVSCRHSNGTKDTVAAGRQRKQPRAVGLRNGHSGKRTRTCSHQTCVSSHLCSCLQRRWLNVKNGDPPWTEYRSHEVLWEHKARQDPDVNLNHISKNLGRNTWKQTMYSFIIYFWPCLPVCRTLVPRPRIEPVPPALGTWSLNHWTLNQGSPCKQQSKQFQMSYLTLKTSVSFSLLFSLSHSLSFLPPFLSSFLPCFFCSLT